ncbi:class I SAM-dependent methyltransferase [Amycolatopsis rubida]|uniref:Class I SAM-dependent methyltransferase n=1 Tax=Amycolatopsis rubida TaxID=112413 RepID=A0ABX0BZ65_9PSEU|nr:class I SAM-dependent methyltransferase [Amycolatopsis sp. M39]MYW93046.1 methyltransferase domain-containing protein [Amycolatopsis rubida]NEC58033.1 class I SAM-dependent methyltransferase [Amycolatopsis rubida]
MFEEDLAGVWDLVYENGRGKDYPGEARWVAETIRRLAPSADSVLDVGCGTGGHLATLAKEFRHAEGVDLSPAMAAIAAAKAPGAAVHVGDMCELDLGRRFDAVVSLYTVVGYLPSAAALRTAVRRMAGHLNPGGVLLVEPWWFAERFLDGYVAADVVEAPGRTIARMSHTARRADRARMQIDYLVAEDDGIRFFAEEHDFGLWSRTEYEQAFDAAGCDVEYVDDVLYCGVFVARPRANPARNREDAAGRAPLRP